MDIPSGSLTNRSVKARPRSDPRLVNDASETEDPDPDPREDPDDGVAELRQECVLVSDR